MPYGLSKNHFRESLRLLSSSKTMGNPRTTFNRNRRSETIGSVSYSFSVNPGHRRTLTAPATPGGGGGEDRVLAAAQQILSTLNAEVREDMLHILSRFDYRLANITELLDCASIADDRFEAAVQIISWRHSDAEASRHTLTWEESPEQAAQYLSAIDDVLEFCQKSSMENAEEMDCIDRADTAIQQAMALLEGEFRHILIRNTVPLDADRFYGSIPRISLSFASNEREINNEDNDSSGVFHERGASVGDNLCLDMINSDGIAELREIADRMIRSGYEKECSQIYTCVRREALDESLVILGAEKLSIEEVQRMEWSRLDETMKKWIQTVKIAARVLLSGEKKLCEEIFDGADSFVEACFNEISKSCLLQLLNFGTAVAIGTKSSEKLFRFLDMRDALNSAVLDLQAMITDEFIYKETEAVLDALGEAARGTFEEFERELQNETSRKPMVRGEIHPLTRYVMNYLKLLVDYRKTMIPLLGICEDDLQKEEEEEGDKLDLDHINPLSKRLLLLITSLESNLEVKSRVYNDPAMQYVFLMNNIWYIVQKVKDSQLGELLGDHWVRKRRGQVRQYATSYLRASWSKALSCLKDEGIGGRSSSKAMKVALKERFKSFNACFEEIYRIQTGWKVADSKLKDELRIYVSGKVIPAYRSFLGRFRNQLESGRFSSKYIKYTTEDLENYCLDLFKGSPSMLTGKKKFLVRNLRKKCRMKSLI